MVNETPEDKPVDQDAPAPEPTPAADPSSKAPPENAPTAEFTPAEAAAADEQAEAETPAAQPPAGEAPGTETPEPITPEPAAPEPAAHSADTPGTETPVDESAASALPELTFGGTVGEGEEAAAPVLVRGRVDKHGVAMGTGRRKTSVARVRIKPGDGQITINGRSIEDYCRIERDRLLIEEPLKAADKLGQVDVWVRVNGGGTTGQAGAIVLGIARALQAMDPTLHETLSEGGYLTRDGRMVERKKYGYKKARKSFQFSKR